MLRLAPLKLLVAGDMAALGGSFGGRTLAAEAPFLGMKFCVVLTIWPTLVAEPEAFRAPTFVDACWLKFVAVFAMFWALCCAIRVSFA